MHNVASGDVQSIEVTVTSVLPQKAHKGQVKVVVTNSSTVDSLISAFCNEQGIRQRYKFVIQTAGGNILESTMSVATAGIKDGAVVYLGTKGQFSEKRTLCCNNWYILAGLCLLIGVTGLAAIFLIKYIYIPQPFDYGIVLDAGSTHTDLFIYKWDGRKMNNTGIVTQIHQCQMKVAISSFESNASVAGDALRPCLDSAQSQIPTNKHSTTPIYLGATAGMRLLQEKNASVSAAVLSSVRAVIQSFPFYVSNAKRQVRIITGQEEGVCGWITVNHIYGNFGDFFSPSWFDIQPANTSRETLGALDMGGASTQITFTPNSTSPQHKDYLMDVRLYGYTYTLYTYSFLCYGLKETLRRYRVNLVKEANYSSTITDPCAPSGYLVNVTQAELFDSPCAADVLGFAPLLNPDKLFTFVGTSDDSSCGVATAQLVNTTICSYKHCSFNNQYLPVLYGNFQAFSGFYYTVSDLNLTASFSLETFRNTTTQFCRKPWSQVKNIPSPAATDLPKFCFNAHYIDTILTAGYGFTGSDWNRIIFKNKVRGADLGWTLGFMINATNAIPTEVPTDSLPLVTFVLLTILFGLFLLCSVGFCCHAKRDAVAGDGRYKRLPTDTGSPSHYGAID